VSQALMDYVTARHEVITAVLEMLTAEYQLSDEYSSILSLTAAQTEVEVAARRLAEATDGLDRLRRPTGWHKPPALSGVIMVARRRVIKAALRCLAAQYAHESADAAGESEYAEEQLALACRNLAADAEAQRAKKNSFEGVRA
jgi:hypothetical protein